MNATPIFRLTLIVVIFFLCSCALTGQNSNASFMQKVQAKLENYNPVDDVLQEELFFSGQHQKVITQLMDRNTQHTAEDYFILGNLLFRIDPNLSWEFHKKAYQLAPDQPEIWLELAMQHHRASECFEALAFYQKLDQLNRLSPAQHALVAHCYLQTNDIENSLKQWEKVDFSNYHTSVDKMIYAVFGELDPLVRYSKLIQSIQNRDINAIAPVLELSQKWDSDWWNKSYHDLALENALVIMEKTWSENTTIGKEVRLFKQWVSMTTVEDLERFCLKHNYFQTADGLPLTPYFRKSLITKALRLKYKSSEELYSLHFDFINQSLNRNEPSLYNLQIIAHLLVSTDRHEQLQEFDDLGWRKHHDVAFAKSYFIGYMIRMGKSPALDDPILLELIESFPNEPYFLVQRYAIAIKRQKKSQNMLTQLINAEYHGLLSNKYRFARDLNSFYKRLRHFQP